MKETSNGNGEGKYEIKKEGEILILLIPVVCGRMRRLSGARDIIYEWHYVSYVNKETVVSWRKLMFREDDEFKWQSDKHNKEKRILKFNLSI